MSGAGLPITSSRPLADAGLRQHSRRRLWFSVANEVHQQDPARRRWPGQLPHPSCSAASRSQVTHTSTVPTSWSTHSSRQAADEWPPCSMSSTTNSHAQDEQLLPGSQSNGWHHGPQAHVQLPVVQEPSPASVSLDSPQLPLYSSQQPPNPPLNHIVEPLATGRAAQSHGSHTSHILNPSAYIMGVITASTTLQQLHASLQQHQQRLNALHASAACVRAAHIARSWPAHSTAAPQHQQCLQQLVPDLLALQQQHLHAFQARQVANSLWAVIRLRSQFSTDHSACAEATQQVAAQLAARLPHVLQDMTPQEISNTWRALAHMPHPPPPDLLQRLASACEPHWHAFKPTELSDVLWAAARTGLGSGLSQQTVNSWLQRAQQAQVACAGGMTPGSLSTCLWATSRIYQESLNQPMDVIGHQQAGHAQEDAAPTAAAAVAPGGAAPGAAAAVVRRVEPAGSSNGGVLRMEWITCMCTTLHVCHVQLTCEELVQALSGVSDLPAPLPAAAAQLAHVLMSHSTSLASHQALTPRAAACCLRAAARLNIRPSAASAAWTHAWLQPLIGSHITSPASTTTTANGTSRTPPATCTANTCTARDLTMALHALAMLGQQPPASTMKQLLLRGQALLEAGTCSPRDVAHMLWVCARLQLLPPASFLAVWQKTAYVVREQFSPAEVAAVFWALGRLRVRMGRKWLSDVLNCVWWRRAEYQTEELLQVLSGLARVHYPLSEGMCQRLLAELKPRCAEGSSSQQLCATLSALAHVHLLPEEVVLWADEVLVGQLLTPHLSSLDPVQLLSTVWACAKLARARPPANRVAEPKFQYAVPRGPRADDPLSTGHSNHHHGSETHTAPGQRHASHASTTTTGIGGVPSHSVAPHVPQPAHAAGVASSNQHRLLESPETQRQHATTTTTTTATTTISDTTTTTTTTATTSSSLDSESELFLWLPLRRTSGATLRLRSHQVSRVLQLALHHQPRLTTQQLAMLLYSLPLLNVQPHTRWLQAMLYSQPHLLQHMTNHELALVVFALGCMRAAPPEMWMQACWAQVLQRASHLNTGMVSGILRGLSMMNASPGAVWMSSFITATSGVLKLMSPRQLVQVHSAAVDLEPQLADEWGHHFDRLLHRDARRSGHVSSSLSSRDEHVEDVEVLEAGWQLRAPPARDVP